MYLIFKRTEFIEKVEIVFAKNELYNESFE